MKSKRNRSASCLVQDNKGESEDSWNKIDNQPNDMDFSSSTSEIDDSEKSNGSSIKGVKYKRRQFTTSMTNPCVTTRNKAKSTQNYSLKNEETKEWMRVARRVMPFRKVKFKSLAKKTSSPLWEEESASKVHIQAKELKTQIKPCQGKTQASKKMKKTASKSNIKNMPDWHNELGYGCYEAVSNKRFRATPSQRRLLDKVNESDDEMLKKILLHQLVKINKKVLGKILSI